MRREGSLARWVVARIAIGAMVVCALGMVAIRPPAPASRLAAVQPVSISNEVTYAADIHVVNGQLTPFMAHRCAGLSENLHYVVFTPTSPGPHPVVFGMQGSGFYGVAECYPHSTEEAYRLLDPVMLAWAQRGYVAVNVEYHGTINGLYGDLTYPGATGWGSTADAMTEWNLKPAIQHFLDSNPAQYGADPAQGLIAFGTSSGAHSAYMVADTGVNGRPVTAAVGWSGFPDIANGGSFAQYLYDQYMRSSAGTSVEQFGDPIHRLDSTAAPQLAVSGLTEAVDYHSDQNYAAACRAAGAVCWTRVPDTSDHAQTYAYYTFTGQPPEMSSPPARIGATVLDDSVVFANPRLDALDRNFLTNLYGDQLQRSPDSPGLAYWAETLDLGGDRSEVARAFAAGDEYRRLVVTADYRTFLGRSPDAGGLAFWSRWLQAGGSDEQLAAAFAGSDEYFTAAGRDDGTFVTRLYETLLGREPDVNSTYWVTALNGGTVSRSDLAYAFLRSHEYRTRLVSILFTTYLDRTADSGGLAYFTDLLGAGARDEDCIAMITASDEYFALRAGSPS